jgi:hypothetical protein
MKQIVALAIIVIILAESIIPLGIGFSQDFAVGEILSHYKEHKIQSSGEISFLEFLTLHYSSDSNHRENNPDRLPSLDGHCVSAFLFVNPVFTELFQIHDSVLNFDKITPGYSISYHFDFSQNLLQPPRA